MIKTLPKTISEFSKLAAERFLQTAVFVDDKIYDRRSGSVAQAKTLVTPPTIRKSASKSASKAAAAPPPQTIIATSPDNEILSSQDIVTSFAKKKIVCSLYQPKKDASVGANSDAYELCSASDIVIVDWDLYGDAGEKTLELVTNLVCQSLDEVPEQLRLILVYTQEPNLLAISHEIYESLESLKPGEVTPPEEDNGLALHTRNGNARVVTVAKPGNRPPEYSAYEVKEKDLAERAVIEFTRLASGLLQGAVLLGLAEIRGNSRKVLSRFDASLDPAFLTHRALSLPHEEAGEHILPLLTDEIRSILEDNLPHSIVTEELIADWCNNIWIPGENAQSFVGKKGDPRQFAVDLCLSGSAVREKYADSIKVLKSIITGKDDDRSWQAKNRPDDFQQLVTYLHSDGTSTANHRLAQLMSQRVQYGDVPRDLKLGTIVRWHDGTDYSYFLCLQPVCDSVRLKSARSFVFCTIQLFNPDRPKRNLVISDGDTYFDLHFAGKAFNCLSDEFEPDKVSEVITSAKVSGPPIRYIFESVSGSKYEWVAQLKPDHAQRAAEQFAREISRVGLTESEWLRLLAK